MDEPIGAESPGGGKRRPGRPPKITDPASSATAALGAELRRLRIDRGLTLAQLGRLIGYSWQHLGAVERGTAVPSEVVVSACDAVVLANGRLVSMLPTVIREQARVRHEHEAARRPSRLTDPVEASARQVCDQEDLDWARLADATRRPSRLNRAVVDDLELITDRQRRLYHELSSAEMMVHVQAHVGLLVSLLDNPQPDSLRHRVASAAAEAAGFAAWLWYDLGDLYSMGHSYRQAGRAGDESTNTGLQSYILGYQGLVERTQGRPKSALELFNQAQHTGQSISDPTRAWLTVLTADALARVGRSREALAALDDSRTLLAGHDGRTDEWMYEFDEGSLAVHAGTCLLTVGRPESAAAAFTDGLRLLPASCERRGAEIELGLATARLASGEVDEAQRLTHTSLETFAARGSVAGLQRVREVRGLFRERGHRGAVAAIDEQVRALGAVSA